MSEIVKITLLGLFFGTFGTTIGGIIGVLFKNPSKKILSFILQFSAGLMSAIICFDLIPEALEISNMSSLLVGIILGILVMILCENAVKKNEKIASKSSSLLKTGIIVGIGLAIHNFPEGLAIGSGFGASIKLGYSVALAIAFHDIPEGISMSFPMKNGGLSNTKAVFFTLLSGVTTGIGAFCGAIVGGISKEIIGVCLAFAAGAMLYIVSGELIPESNKIYKGRIGVIGNIAGFIMGMIVFKLI